MKYYNVVMVQPNSIVGIEQWLPDWKLTAVLNSSHSRPLNNGQVSAHRSHSENIDN
jgi:hypothetical protein